MNLKYPDILTLIQEHCDPKRNESASFLIWYLENYYRLDSLEAVDCVCDQKGDKGIDGIFVNDNLQTIHVFQSRISQKNTAVGDVSLKEFAGTLDQLSDRDSVEKLIASAGNAQVAALLKGHGVADKISEYELRGEFLSNVELDNNGSAYIEQNDAIAFVGPDALESTYISNERDLPIATDVTFDVSGFNIMDYTVDTQSKAYIAPIRARDLLKLDGIANQSIFTLNVRGPLGNTNVNKDIAKSIRDSNSHKHFPLFHNGITVIAGSIELHQERLTISDYLVVNGCQSLTAFYKNEPSLTDNLHVLTKFIRVQPGSSLAQQITEFSNNQNGVKARDFKSNNSIQIRLQNEFREGYGEHYEYSIKRGEPIGANVTISNEDAGLYLMAFDLKEPWATHRKYQIFDDKHASLFGRPEVNADRIVMLHIIREEVDKQSGKKIANTLFARYVLTRYLMMYIVRAILEDDDLGRSLIENPTPFVRVVKQRVHFRSCIQTIARDVAIDLDGEVREYEDDFDYRGTST